MRSSLLHFFSAILVFGSVLFLSSPAFAANLMGVAVDQNGEFIDGAAVLLDRAPGDGEAEYSTLSNLFGFFQLADVEPGEYTVAISHPVFGDDSQTVELADDRKATVIFEMESKEGEFFDLDMFAQGVVSNITLPDARFTVERFDSETAGAPAETLTFQTDVNGRAKAFGLPVGWYRFTVEREGWETLVFPEETPQRIDSSHMASANLEPNGYSLTVHVTGIDPKEGEYSPEPVALSGITVEVVGLDFLREEAGMMDPGMEMQDPKETEVVPARNLRTDENGEVIFPDLPAVRWKVRVLKLGYHPTEVFVTPEEMLAGSVEKSVLLELDESTRLRVEVESEYEDVLVGSFPELTLEGIPGTATEGITRYVGFFQDGSATGPDPQAVGEAEVLLPGRYILHGQLYGRLNCGSSGGIWSTEQAQVEGQGQRHYIEIAAGEEAVRTIRFDPIPSRVRGVLKTHDQHQPGFTHPPSNVDDGEYQGERTLLPHEQAGVAIEFVPQDTLPGPGTVITAFTDSSGQYATLLPPHCYSVRIPSMTDYMGARTLRWISFPGEMPEIKSSWWPYPDPWPHPDRNYAEAPFAFSSSGLYDMELQLHRKFVDMVFLVMDGMVWDQVRPFSVDQALWHDLNEEIDPQITVDGTPVTTYRTVRANGIGQYAARGMQSGTYSVTVDHPHKDMASVTVEIADWPAYPGVPPAISPDDPTFKMAGNYWVSFDFPDIITGQMATDYDPDSPFPEFFAWDTTTGSYTPHSGEIIGIELDEYPGIIWAETEVPASGATVYVRSFAPMPDPQPDVPVYGSAQMAPGQTSNFYVNGASMNMSTTVPFPTGTFDLELTTTLEDGTEVAGIEIDLGNGVLATTPTTVSVSNWDGTANPTNLGWQRVRERFSFASGGTPGMKLDLEVKKVMPVTGTVTVDGGGPAEAIVVSVYDKRGSIIDVETTDSSGQFTAQVDYQSVYLQIKQEGYYPIRVRRDPGPPDNPDIDVSLDLVPLPPPQITSMKFDRYGLFLPGVLKSGDAQGINPDNARGSLTMTFSVEGNADPITYTLEPFEGQANAGTVTLDDEITNVWLVDRRIFPGDFYVDETQIDTLDLSAGLDFLEANALLKDVGSQVRDGIPFLVVSSRGDRQASGTVEGKVELWTLPPGPVDPWLIAMTKHGAVRVLRFDYPAGKPPLRGAKIPVWAQNMLDIIGFVGNYQGAVGADSAKLPEQFAKSPFLPTPDVEGAIGLSNGFLSYDYSMKVDVSQSEDSPSSGLLAMAADFGMKVGVKVGFKADGQTGFVTLGGAGSLSKEYAIEKGLGSPGILQRLDVFDVKVDPTVSGQAALEIAQQLGPQGGPCTGDDDCALGVCVRGAAESGTCSDPFPDYKMTRTVGGSISSEVKLPTSNVIRYLGPLGSALSILGQLDILEVYLVLKNTLGAAFSQHITTTGAAGTGGTGGTTTGPDYPARSDYLGMDEPLTEEQKLAAKLTLLLGGGLEVSAFGGVLAAGGLIQVGPQNDTAAGGMEIILDVTEAWPVLKRVKGAVSTIISLSAKLAGIKVSRDYQFDGWRFDWQFGTEPFFDLKPTNVEVEVETPLTAAASEWVGDEGILVDSFYGAAIFAANDSGVLYTQPTDDGNMELMFSSAAPDGWDAPVPVGAMAGATDVALFSSDETIVALWAELAEGDVGNVFAGTTLRYSTSENGLDWSAAKDVATTAGLVYGFDVANVSGEQVVAWGMANDYALSADISVHSLAFDGSGFSEPMNVRPAAHLRDLDVIPGSGSLIATDADFVARSMPGEPGAAATEWASEVRLVSAVRRSENSRFAVVHPSSGIRLMEGDGAQWTTMATIASGHSPRELVAVRFPESEGSPTLIAWVANDGADAVWYLFVDDEGQILEEPRRVTAEDFSSQLHEIQIVPAADGSPSARLLARLTGEPDLLVEFVLGLGQEPILPAGVPAGPGGTDGPGVNNGTGADAGFGGDAGSQDGADGQEDGCGCGSTSGKPLTPWILFAIFGFVWIRRRRNAGDRRVG